MDNEEFIEALKPYLRHRSSCNSLRQDWNGGVPGPCDCGLGDVIAKYSALVPSQTVGREEIVVCRNCGYELEKHSHPMALCPLVSDGERYGWHPKQKFHRLAVRHDALQLPKLDAVREVLKHTREVLEYWLPQKEYRSTRLAYTVEQIDQGIESALAQLDGQS